MISFKNLRLKTKQAIGFGIILFILALVIFFVISQMRELHDQLEIASENSLPRAIAISDVNYYSSKLRIAQLQYSLIEENKTKKELENQISDFIDMLNQSLDKYHSLKNEYRFDDEFSNEENELFANFDVLWEEYQDLSIRYFILEREGNEKEAYDLLNTDAKIVFDAYSSILREMLNLYGRYLETSFEESTQNFNHTRNLTITLLIATIAFTTFVAMAIVRLITVPVRRLEEAALAVAEGDLYVNVKYHSKDELGWLAQTFNEMIRSLREAREKAEEKSEKLRMQWEVLRETNEELQEKSNLLEKQKQQIEQKNRDLENALIKLKETQNQLVQSEKMASVGQLTAGIAHEINNPINFVSSNVSPLKRDIADLMQILKEYEEIVKKSCKNSEFASVDELKEDLEYDYIVKEVDDLLEGIEVGAQRTAEIVKGLRNFSRIDEDDQKKADIHQGIDSTLLVLHNELKRHIKIIKNYGDLPEVLCFPGKLNQVFLNIIKNASQAIEGEGTIEITTSASEENIKISIKDNGSGMDQETINKIYDPFFTTKEVGVGTGLGLSISYAIVQEHGGNIIVKSEPGKGSEFIITLPRRE